VLYRRHAAWPRLETSATVAAAIPDATFAVVDGTTTNPWSEGHEEIQRLVDAFLARPVQKAQRRAPSLPPLNPQTPPARLFGLTFRELEVLQHVAAGASNQEIATALFLSVRTVEKHIANIYGKLELRGRADAAAFAVRKGLVPSA
jgi:DNA-binding NarL/FixJ family response regulator